MNLSTPGAGLPHGQHVRTPDTGSLIGGGVIIIGGLVEVFLGIDAEGKPLEQIAAPLTVIDG